MPHNIVDVSFYWRLLCIYENKNRAIKLLAFVVYILNTAKNIEENFLRTERII